MGTFTCKSQTDKVADNAANATASIGNVYFLLLRTQNIIFISLIIIPNYFITKCLI